MEFDLPPATLLGVIEMQNEIAARRLGFDGVLALACRRAADLSGAHGATVELGGKVVHRAGNPAGAAISAPLERKGVAVGALAVFAPHGERAAAALLAVIGDVIGAHMPDAVAQLHGPRSDAVTGLGSRSHYEERLASEVRRAAAAGRDLSLCLFELEEPPADADTLLAVAQVLEQVRDSDEAFRIGPFSFALLLPFTPLEPARGVAARIAAEIASVGPARAAYAVADVRGPDPAALHAAAAEELEALRHVRRATSAA